MYTLLAVLALAVLIPLAGVLYQRSGAIGDARRFPAPGRRVDIGALRLHIDASGTGSPPVVFEAGIAATSLSWRLVQPEIARLTQTASYDRAGLGWSDAALTPRSLPPIVEELRALLERAGLGIATTGPRILVAHSYGALIARSYAARYPAEIAGMVLVDPVAAGEWAKPSALHRKMLRRGILLARRGAWLARLGVVRFALNRLTGGERALPKFIARASSGHATGLIERMVGQIRKLPPEVWPMVQSHWCDPKCFEGMARYLETLPECATETGTLPDIPVIVLSAENASLAERAERHALVGLCPQGRIEIVRDSGHWIQLDRPGAVVRAIEEMVTKCRS